MQKCTFKMFYYISRILFPFIVLSTNGVCTDELTEEVRFNFLFKW